VAVDPTPRPVPRSARRPGRDDRRRLPWGLEPAALIRGAAAYLVIAVPCALVISLAHGHDTPGQESSLWVVAAVLVLLVAPVVGGLVAGTAQPSAPLTHAAAAVGVPAGLFLVVRIIVGLVRGSLTAGQVVSFLLYLVVFTGLAVVGGYLAFRRRSHTV
jgi:ABC-type Na+ efflux pump permease subunit